MGDHDLFSSLWTRAAHRKSRADYLGLVVVADRTGDECVVEFGRQGRDPERLTVNVARSHLPIPESCEGLSERRGPWRVLVYRWPNPSPPQPALALELTPIVPVERTDDDDDSLEARFERFHAANPHVYQALVSLAMPLVRAGRKRIGIGMLYEKLRYDYAVATAGDDYKLNNNWRAYYARMMMRDHPELDGLFEIRQQRS